ncbi:putative exosome complex exonuclease RRP44 [Operophtera brumata]|uniref:Putative exosome complex exonuclease RRP44 n=1 Tax=Operophtera brumata TaxID=104452 RepID=A0A0L7LCQ7_OPEBR|nr:putative exosome complex exonuclease RRP44 [Operophtera brumata]
MTSLQEISPEGDVCRSRLSNSELSTSSQKETIETQNQTKVSICEEDKASLGSPHQAEASALGKDQVEEVLSKKLMTAMTTNEDDKTCEPIDSKPNPKGKNARKKRKQLKMQPVNSADPNQAQTPPGTNNIALNGLPSQDFYQNYVSPVYAHTNSRYLENLTYHPQFQFLPNVQNQMNMQQAMQALSMQQTTNSGAMTHTMHSAVMQSAGMQPAIQSVALQYTSHTVVRQHSVQSTAMPHTIQYRPHPASAPTTPLALHQRPSTGSIPNSPNSGFFQNMMQHPLLSHSYVQSNYNCNVQNNLKTTAREVKETRQSKSSPKHKNKHKNNNNNNKNEATTTTEDKRFDAYMSAEEVEVGLRNNTLFEGVLRINPKQFQHAYISTFDREEQDVFIDGLRNRNRALEGDVVVVMLIEGNSEEDKIALKDEKSKKKVEASEQVEQEDKSDQKEEKNYHNEENTEQSQEKGDLKRDKKDQKRGKVVFIKEKVHTRTCIGNLKLMPDRNRQRALFIPRDHRVPRLNIPFVSWPDNFYQDAKKYENTLFLAKIHSWTDTRFALGNILCNIGQSGNMKSETLAILAENDLDITPFGPEVRDLFPRLDYTIPKEEIKIREDCRNLCLFSIDPSNCRDIDDAISCKELRNGNYEVGVHISDVAHYLTEDTILDEKVAQKATTIYLVERAYHMLPDELCMLCSLFPGVDKLAFSVFWEITKDGKVLSHRFAKTVINSCCQLAYEHAQAILEKKEYSETSFPETYNNFKYEDVRKSIEIIGGMAAIFRHNRFENGALRIDQPKVAFRLSAVNGLPDSYSFYEIKESHQMIEEFMLLANMTVARRIYEDHPKLAFLRCHPPPSGFMLKQLAKALDPMGIELDISSAGALHRSLLPYTDPATCDKGRAMVLNMLCAKPMTRAKYFCADSCEDDDFLHYALNIPIYTHFTSPIRRYADIMVHRLLAASLKFRENPTWVVDKVRAVAAQCNKQKYNAKKAGEMSSDLYMLKYIEMNSPIQTEAVVVEVREKYIDVIVVAMGLNRRIFFNTDFPGEFNCIKHECGSIKMSRMEITWRAEDNIPESKQVIEVFSILQVHLHKADDMVKIETKLVRQQ